MSIMEPIIYLDHNTHTKITHAFTYLAYADMKLKWKNTGKRQIDAKDKLTQTSLLTDRYVI
jgi:hypothetical protein